MATTDKKKATESRPVPVHTVPGVDPEQGRELAQALQIRLHSLNDLQLTLKHAHWNVVGPKFIGVHEMLDPQVDGVREMVDALAERMAAMGVPPNGLPGDLVAKRTWDDYPIMLGQAAEHLGALDLVYTGVIKDHRKAIEQAGEVDPVTEDLLIGQVAQLEQYQWFIRAHLMDDEGRLATQNAKSTEDAAAKALKADVKID
ncbi:MAG: DNA starvation/stationary phase protection protein [Brooklawnia sp.]|uniref:Dps family protein n=1 Tax=Brooklawnia sp. TaxID=2699740 RepID=UPI003C771036